MVAFVKYIKSGMIMTMCQEFSRYIGKLDRIFLNFLGKKNIQEYSQENFGGKNRSKSDESALKSSNVTISY